MSQIITVSVDLKLLDKTKFKPFKKRDGSEALYCDLVLIETPNGKFGDFMVKQGQSKEEREARTQTPILGNAKYLKRREPAPKSPTTESGAVGGGDADDSVPF